MVETIPPGYHAVTPWIVSTQTAAVIDFLKKAFGAFEIARVSNPDGSIGHAEVRIGDAIVMMFDVPGMTRATPAYLRLYVDDADRVFRQALDAGASAVTEITELFWGDRVGRVRDPFGNVWWIQQRVEELDAAEMGRRMQDPRYAEAMQYVQDTLISEIKRE